MSGEGDNAEGVSQTEHIEVLTLVAREQSAEIEFLKAKIREQRRELQLLRRKRGATFASDSDSDGEGVHEGSSGPPGGGGATANSVAELEPDIFSTLIGKTIEGEVLYQSKQNWNLHLSPDMTTAACCAHGNVSQVTFLRLRDGRSTCVNLTDSHGKGFANAYFCNGCWSPDGKFACFIFDYNRHLCLIVNPKTQTTDIVAGIDCANRGTLQHMLWSPSGKILIVLLASTVWQASFPGNIFVKAFPLLGGVVVSCCIDESRGRLIALSAQGTVEVYDFRHRCLARMTTPLPTLQKNVHGGFFDPVSQALLSPNGTRLFVSANVNSMTLNAALDLKTCEWLPEFGTPSHISAADCQWHPDGVHLLTLDGKIWDTTRGVCVATLLSNVSASRVGWDLAGRCVWGANGSPGAGGSGLVQWQVFDGEGKVLEGAGK